jgi:brefeldin A-resistance guanine nucleotide exchange factor 1
LSAELISSDGKEWSSIFDEVLFPLVLHLLKPEVYHSDPIGMTETRVQAATLVCKIFLRFLDQLPNREGMLPLWLRILDILDRMMNSGQTDSLEEAIPESLKNILLVMADGGYLVSPDQDSSKEEMWNETRKRLGRFLPDLFGEIFPDAGKEAETSQPPSAVPSAPPSAVPSAVSSPQPNADAESKPEEAPIASNDAEESKEADGAETKSPSQEDASS